MGKPKHSSLCPGCKTPKKDHTFGFPGKNWAGLPPNQESIPEDAEQESSDHATSPPCQDCQVNSTPQSSTVAQWQEQSQPQLLAATRNLSLQLEGLAKEQNTMKKRMEEISVKNAPKTVCEPSQPSGVDKLS